MLNSTTSNGTTWLTATNNVTVTSDLTSGNGGAIQIRTVNSCNASLAKTNPPKEIQITRPEPPLSITGATQLCFPNSYNYTLSGVPIGAVVTWGTSSYYSLISSGNTATITPTSAANGGTNITASVFLPTCGLTFTKSLYVSIGTPYATFSINSYPQPEPNCYEVWGIYSFQAQQITGYPNTYSNTQWGWRNLTLGTSYTDPTIYGLSYTFFPYDAGQYEIWVKATNDCGVSSLESIKTVNVLESCAGSFRMQNNVLNTYPNPTKGMLKIQIPKAYQNISQLEISNQMGTIVMRKMLRNSVANLDIDLSNLKEGVYQITLRTGKNIMQTKVIKQ